jgi:pectinesterase
MQFNTTGSAPSEQVAPGTASRPILSADEAKNFDRAHYFSRWILTLRRGPVFY